MKRDILIFRGYSIKAKLSTTKISDIFLMVSISPLLILGTTFMNQLYAKNTDFILYEK